jgi:hypothetical protein
VKIGPAQRRDDGQYLQVLPSQSLLQALSYGKGYPPVPDQHQERSLGPPATGLVV